jgi:hypothetical protein
MAPRTGSEISQAFRLVEWAYRKHVNPAQIAGSVRVDDRRDLMAQMALDPEFIRVGDAPVRQEVAAAPIQDAPVVNGESHAACPDETT